MKPSPKKPKPHNLKVFWVTFQQIGAQIGPDDDFRELVAHQVEPDVVLRLPPFTRAIYPGLVPSFLQWVDNTSQGCGKFELVVVGRPPFARIRDPEVAERGIP